MTTQQGFGKVQPRKKTGKGTAKREEAAQKYEKMKEGEMPEFHIFMRIQGKKNWFPVGSLMVNRTSKINQAIFDTEEELRQGGFRLFPILRKNQQHLEYGYRLKGKEYAEDPIELAVRPPEKQPNFIQSAIAKLKESFSGNRNPELS